MDVSSNLSLWKRWHVFHSLVCTQFREHVKQGNEKWCLFKFEKNTGLDCDPICDTSFCSSCSSQSSGNPGVQPPGKEPREPGFIPSEALTHSKRQAQAAQSCNTCAAAWHLHLLCCSWEKTLTLQHSFTTASLQTHRQQAQLPAPTDSGAEAKKKTQIVDVAWNDTLQIHALYASNTSPVHTQLCQVHLLEGNLTLLCHFEGLFHKQVEMCSANAFGTFICQLSHPGHIHRFPASLPLAMAQGLKPCHAASHCCLHLHRKSSYFK